MDRRAFLRAPIGCRASVTSLVANERIGWAESLGKCNKKRIYVEGQRRWQAAARPLVSVHAGLGDGWRWEPRRRRRDARGAARGRRSGTVGQQSLRRLVPGLRPVLPARPTGRDAHELGTFRCPFTFQSVFHGHQADL